MITKREREILELLSNGKNTEEISNCLHIPKKRVNAHICHVISKTGTKNRTDLAVKYLLGYFKKEPLLDQICLLILKEVAKDSACSYCELARMFGKTRKVIYLRVDKLKRLGYLVHSRNGYIKNLTEKGYEKLNGDFHSNFTTRD